MTSSVRRSRPASPSFLALMLIAGTGSLSTDTYIAALPEVQRSLGTSASTAQLTMTACIAGMAVGQLLIGPVSDARGRRRLILMATMIFTAMSVVCIVASTGETLIAARAVQGIACGAAAAVGRAVVSDVYVGREASAKFGTLSALSLIAPVAGPAIGGVLLTFGTWRIIFGFLGGVGVAMTIAAVFGLPETLPSDRRQPGGFRQLRRRGLDLLTDRSFAVPVLVQCLTVGGFFVYIGGSSFVLQIGVGISQRLYSVLFGVNAAAMMLSSVAFRLLVLRLGPVVLRRAAMIVQSTAIGAFFLGATLWPGHQPPLALIWVCLATMTLGLGTFLPANSSIAQLAGRRFGGTASALGGGIPFLVGSLTTPVTGLLGRESVWLMAGAMAVFFTAAAVTAILLGRPSERPQLRELPMPVSEALADPLR